MTNMHNAGAAALVMHRGADNVKTDVGVGLLFSVRSQLVRPIWQDLALFCHTNGMPGRVRH